MLVTLMSAALKSSRRKRSASNRSQVHTSALDARRPATLSPIGVQRLPSQDSVPTWVRSLLMVQQASVFATFALAGSVLAVYGWTVYSQQVWGKEYQHLETLRRNERQLTTNKEMLKDQIAKQGNRPGTALTPQSPDKLIFLTPASSQRSAATASPQAPPTGVEANSKGTAPLGY